MPFLNILVQGLEDPSEAFLAELRGIPVTVTSLGLTLNDVAIDAPVARKFQGSTVVCSATILAGHWSDHRACEALADALLARLELARQRGEGSFPQHRQFAIVMVHAGTTCNTERSSKKK